MFINSNLNTHDFEIKKISDGMLWHMRIGHASINYLKQIQKNHNELKNIKFDESIKDCEVCIMAKKAKTNFFRNKNQNQTSWKLLQIQILVIEMIQRLQANI